MDSEIAREQMIYRHLKKRGIHDNRVLEIMSGLKRELFVPADVRENAYDDNPLPIGYNQTISQPYIVAFMTENLDVHENHKVLEIGTGSGYQTAILAQLSQLVYTVERIEELAFNARQTFRFLGIDNVKSVIADGSQGLPEDAPFDRIMVTAAAKTIPQLLIEQLTVGGKMIIPIGEKSSNQKLFLVQKELNGVFQKTLCYVRFVPLIGNI
jgi:protein-L-isoaspartate(D-aspartate) O-methyltransferase